MSSPPLPSPGNSWEVAYAGPESSVTSLTLTSTRELKRPRRNQGYSEDSTDDIPIQARYFQVGSPKLFDLGAIWEVVPQSSPLGQEWTGTIQPRVKEILENHNIKLETILLIYYPVENSAEAFHDLTTLIYAVAIESEQEWIPAVKDIRNYYLSIDRPEIGIEIRDDRSHEKMNCYPLTSSEPVVPIWRNIEHQVIDTLRLQDWLSLSLMRRGTKSGPKPISVVLTISQTSTMDWVEIREDLVRILEGHKLNYVAVEILKGERVLEVERTSEIETLSESMGSNVRCP
ncbi:hypothetical protein AJ79_07833 [Helicocarpus griseus UAMH5409]|uniref:Uncharacterized protein n=1 Tax=Helicocarpus griseus UAMH5409 TaxID=1447875 RepID=A0A2B7WYM7_9EURO|nr:hypothetical protein AJ79_07833 [Helicocarpus griseus UAMH5409]